MFNISRIILLIVACLTVPTTYGQTIDPTGRWLLESGEANLLIVDLRRDARGGWVGVVDRPNALSIGSTSILPSGPMVQRAILSVKVQPDGAHLITIEAPGGTVDFLFRQLTADTATLGPAAGPELTFPLKKIPVNASPKLNWIDGHAYPVVTEAGSNREIAALFDADQAARQDVGKIDWSVVSREDEVRRTRARALLDAGALRSGNDFYHAAFIFQHGAKPEDYLLAHVLAVAAVARGQPNGSWIAAATLDRYLQNIGKSQVFGTQFQTPNEGKTTQEPYNRVLIPDSLRTIVGVPVQMEQEKQRQQFDAEAVKRGSAKP